MKTPKPTSQPEPDHRTMSRAAIVQALRAVLRQMDDNPARPTVLDSGPEGPG
jgi:hypothetical protein